jgi:hypothetical protein
MIPIAKRLLRAIAISAFLLSTVSAKPALQSGTEDSDSSNRKNFACRYDGFGRVDYCGMRVYARVFTGSVASVVLRKDNVKELQLIPEEVFLGEPISEVNVILDDPCALVNQPEIKVGDQWLFFLSSYGFHQNDHTATDLFFERFNPSKPLPEAQDEIDTLRYLAQNTETGILDGKVERIGPTLDQLNPTPVPNRMIIASNMKTGSEFTVLTNLNGHYIFDLPPGHYKVTANTEHGLRELDSNFPMPDIPVSKRSCISYDIKLLADGKLAGTITRPNGKPASSVTISIIRTEPVGAPTTVVTDTQGHFEVSGRQPGDYVVGIGLLAPYSSSEWKSRVYYPGVRTKEEATVIHLDDGEWRTDLDFKLPANFTAK